MVSWDEMFRRMVLAALASIAVGATVSDAGLEVAFPFGTAGQPSISLGGQLWAHSTEMVAGDGCIAVQTQEPTVNDTGTDGFGAFASVETEYKACGIAVKAVVRVYDNLPAAVLSVKFPNGAEQTRLSNATASASLAPIVSFPSIPFSAPMTRFRQFSWRSGQLGFGSGIGISPATFVGQTGNVPSPHFFVGPGNSTLVVAPLDHFHSWVCKNITVKSGADLDRTTRVAVQQGGDRWGCGTMNTVDELPPGFESATLLWGGVGVTDTMARWGGAMQRYYNTTRVRDLQTTMLGVYTDNGAFYNNPSNFLGRTAPEVFQEMFDGFRRDGVPADNYLMLDDWWYTAIHPGSMLIDSPLANPEYFPLGLSELWERIGKVPLDVYSVHYTDNFTLFGGERVAGSIPHIHDDWAPPGGWLPGPGVEPSKAFYNRLFNAWGAAQGMLRMHEIDFLVFLTYETPSFQADPEGARWFLEGMNDAAIAANISIQYCSASAIDAMQSLRFPAVTNIRASTDYACFVNYEVGTGFLISWALGLRPSKDVLWTTEVQPTLTKPPGAGCGGNIKGCSSCGGNFSKAQHYTAELDLVLALFSTGPVGLGDGLNFTNATRAKATATANGTLLQPDKPLTPFDWSIFGDLTARIQFDNCIRGHYPCTPQLLQTHTRLAATDVASQQPTLQWHHIVAVAVLSYPLSIEDLWPLLPLEEGWSYATVRRSKLGHGCADGAMAFGARGCAMARTTCVGGGLCLPVIDTEVGFWDEPNLHIAWAQYLLAPCAPSGWCLLGEMDKYNPASTMRLHNVLFNDGGIDVEIKGVAGETVRLYAITPEDKIMVRNLTVRSSGAAQASFKRTTIGGVST